MVCAKRMGRVILLHKWIGGAFCPPILGGLTMQIHYVDGEDWVGLYIDGKLIYEGHDIHVTLLLDILNKRGIINCQNIECDSEWLVEHGGLSQNIDDVKERKQ